MAKDTGKVNIHGKEYETVASRVQRFRETYTATDGWAITTEIIERDDVIVVMKASILKDGVVLSTGHSEEVRTSSSINRTSALENAETSAIGRALASFGMAGTEFASADEVAHAISRQGGSQSSYKPQTVSKPGTNGHATDNQRAEIFKVLKLRGYNTFDSQQEWLAHNGIQTPLTVASANKALDILNQPSSTRG